MKTKGAKISWGLLLLAGLILLASNISYAGDNDNGPSWGPGWTANYDKGNDGQGPNLPFNLFKPPEQPPQQIGFYDGRDRDSNQDQNRGHHYGWGHHGGHHHHPSPSN